MKIRTLALVVAFSGMAGAALADARAEAILQKPVTGMVKTIAGETSWSCLGTVCAAYPASESVQSVSVCRALAKVAGPIASYSFDGRPFAADLLTRCNAK